MGSSGLVIITGASSGIGEATAKAFSKAGYPLLLLARRKAQLDALKLPNTLCERVDVTDLAGIEAAVEKAEKKFGTPCGLINNAGISLPGPIATLDPADYRNTINVNVIGV